MNRSSTMAEPTRNNAAADLERCLGDPLDRASDFSFEQALLDDELERFPEKLCRGLDDWGLNEYYVPRELGGRFTSFEELFSIVKVVSRRDLTAAIAHSAIYLGAASVWMSGTQAQKHRLAGIIRKGGAVAFALTEQAHGSDIMATGLTAERDGDRYLLSGEKWLINNATRSAAVVAFARTRPERGPRGFSLFFLDKEKLAPATYRYLPKLKTHGIRGADISGIAFDRCPVPADAVIGAPGAGLELTLKTLQISRTMCAALSLGAANAALHTTLGFALRRQLYGKDVYAIPEVQKTLVDAFLDILICDCMAAAAVRGLHTATRQFSVWSAVVKYFVPVTLENAIRSLSSVLGARYYLRQGTEGVFQKTARDSAIVSVFDGNTAVNLQAIALQLRFLLPEHAPDDSASTAAFAERVKTTFDLTRPLPEFDAANLELFNHGHDDVLHGLSACVEYLREAGAGSQLDEALAGRILGFVKKALEDLGSLKAKAAKLAEARGSTVDKSSALFELSRQYCVLHAAAACLQMWIHNKAHVGAYFAKGEWLLLALNRLLGSGPHPDPTLSTDAVRELAAMHARRESVSINPFVFS
ncbi:MAG: acyl-CoA dehydrogenase protein [Betaproteobacteria bacterium]|nr:acyl-CoA dehydrogenase protein [Betaproteobacteria bacterium]